MQPSTEFTPTLRVTRDGCYMDDNNLPRVCAAPYGDVPFRHFFAEAGHEYFVTVDSPEGTDGHYAMQVVYTSPPIEGCLVHSTQINQEIGGLFMWNNVLGGRAGIGRRPLRWTWRGEHVPAQRVHARRDHLHGHRRRPLVRAGAQHPHRLRRRDGADLHLDGGAGHLELR